MTDPKTIAIYDSQAAQYAEMTDSYNTDDPRLTAFIAACPPNASVLDLGCGPGASAAAMARAGLTVTATDASASMVEMANAHPGVTARQETFDDLDGTALYDGIWANFSLLHAPRADFPGFLSTLHRMLKPQGRLHLGLKLGTGETRDALGRLYTYYETDELKRLLDAAGFEITDLHFGRGEGLDGTMSDWILVAAHA